MGYVWWGMSGGLGSTWQRRVRFGGVLSSGVCLVGFCLVVLSGGVRFGGCGLVGCDFVGCGLAGCCLVGAAQGAAGVPAGTRASEEPRVCVRARAPGSGRGRASRATCACPERRRGVRARLAVVARARYTACGRRAQVHGCMFHGCAHTCARDESSLRFGRSSTSLKSSFVSSSMRSACARPLAERPDTPSTPPATAWRRESRRRNEAISRK